MDQAQMILPRLGGEFGVPDCAVQVPGEVIQSRCLQVKVNLVLFGLRREFCGIRLVGS